MILGRVVADGEALWLPEDLAWAKALLALDADTCPGCGHPRSETTDPDAEGAYRAVLTACHACAAIQVESTVKPGERVAPGLYVGAIRKVSRG